MTHDTSSSSTPTFDYGCEQVSVMLRWDIHFDGFVSVPFDEDEKDRAVWFLDHDYMESMYSMFKKVNGRSTPVACQSNRRVIHS